MPITVNGYNLMVNVCAKQPAVAIIKQAQPTQIITPTTNCIKTHIKFVVLSSRERLMLLLPPGEEKIQLATSLVNTAKHIGRKN